MDLIVLKTKYYPDPKKIAQKYGIDEEDSLYPALASACEEVSMLAEPVVCYKKSNIDEIGSDYIVIDGVRFTGKFIADRLKGLKTVYPYVASCGPELDSWGRNCDDLLLEYCYDDIRQGAIAPIMELLHATIAEKNGNLKLSSVNPGSIPLWPITEQQPLFELLGSVYEKTGVRLDKTMLMYPLKSVSGILFENEEGYCNCRICSRKNCPGRREQADEEEILRMLNM
ncbi:MAG: hypothetical protein ACOX3Q_01425 [Clostridia bacterium]|jgi:hypothetical protein|nr:hypothetical protein [Clostridiaceae bacterium]